MNADTPARWDPLDLTGVGGRIYDLEQPRSAAAPTIPAHAPAFVYRLHSRHEPDSGEPRTTAAGTIFGSDHSGTHIDALCHQAERMRLHGGIPVGSHVQRPDGFTAHDASAIEPIVSRGVLIDVAGFLGVTRVPERDPISAELLREAARAAQITVTAGDVVLVRTGSGAIWEQPDAYLRSAGMAASASRWLAGQRVRAVGADNSSWDVSGATDPELGITLPGHLILLVRAGIYIIEHLNLEELARDKACEFLFVCAPLKLRGATGSPVRPLAIRAGSPVTSS